MKSFFPNHTALYLGNTKNIIIHAAGLDVHKSRLQVYLNKRHRVRIYHKPDLTVSRLQLIKEYLFSRLGKFYDWAGIVSFLLPFIKEWPNADYCVEVVRDS